MNRGINEVLGRVRLVLAEAGWALVYHSTNPEAARQIVRTRKLKPKAEPDVYVSNVPHTAYGHAVVQMRVPERVLELDDEFPDGRVDYRIHVGYGGRVRVVDPKIVREALEDVRDIRGRVWDVERAARELSRFEFIAYFVARKTRRKADRELVGDHQLVRTKKGWVDIVHLGREKVPQFSPTKDLNRVYDYIRRGPLGFYVRQAEDYRIDVLG